MRWQNMDESDNVEDRRGQRAGGSRGFPIGGKGGILLFVAVLVAGYYGIDLTPLIGDGGGSYSETSSYTPTAEENEMARFTSVALKSTEDVWQGIFRQLGEEYTPPKLVLYTETTTTGCGYGQSAMGPFYCPEDRTVYIDVAFYRDMQNRLGGGGDFAQGYVLAHEVGHHVQHLAGLMDKVAQLKAGASEAEANQLSVRVELQADCYAGIWGKAMQQAGVLDEGDLEEALRTAQAIGDDRLQKEATGRVVPDSFTHGTSEQRLYWFRRGFDGGDPKQCNTFADMR